MKTKTTRLIFFILTISTFITIFIFSNQDGEKSGKTSRGFTRAIIDTLPITKNFDEERKIQLIESTQNIVRKLAHFSIYTVLGINLMGFINTYDNIKIKNKILITLFIGIIYATSDELHQMFSGDRTPAIKDVLIDTSGVLFGLSILTLINLKKHRKLNKCK